MAKLRFIAVLAMDRHEWLIYAFGVQNAWHYVLSAAHDRVPDPPSVRTAQHYAQVRVAAKRLLRREGFLVEPDTPMGVYPDYRP